MVCYVYHLRKEPENITGSWGIIAIFERKIFNGTVDMLMSSIKISPLTLANLNKAPINEDFPAPEDNFQ